MIILDTDILSIIDVPDTPEYVRLQARIAQVPREEQILTTVINYEEQTRGWLDYAARAKTDRQLAEAYGRLRKHLVKYRSMEIVAFDLAAVELFGTLRSTYRRTGRNDLRIAAICLLHDALLVTRNLKDFGAIRGLRVEDWTSRGLGG
jgi:tRNA(fMet)-specific endonuclease VapC